jgi:hypothetical protein
MKLWINSKRFCFIELKICYKVLMKHFGKGEKAWISQVITMPYIGERGEKQTNYN